MERILCSALRNMGSFRFHVGLTGHCHGSRRLDEIRVKPFENDGVRLALYSNLRGGNLLCATDVSIPTRRLREQSDCKQGIEALVLASIATRIGHQLAFHSYIRRSFQPLPFRMSLGKVFLRSATCSDVILLSSRDRYLRFRHAIKLEIDSLLS